MTRIKVLLLDTRILSVPANYEGAIEAHVYCLVIALSELGCKVHYVTKVGRGASFHKNVVDYNLLLTTMRFPIGFPWWIFTHSIRGASAFRGVLEQ